MIVTVCETRDIDACQALRRRILVEELGIPEAVEMDGEDAGARHFLARADGAAAGTARLVITKDAGRIGHVCVLPRYRGAGIGHALTRAAIDAARRTPVVTRVTLGARRPAVSLYARLGFVVTGPVQQTDWGDSLPMALAP